MHFGISALILHAYYVFFFFFEAHVLHVSKKQKKKFDEEYEHPFLDLQVCPSKNWWDDYVALLTELELTLLAARMRHLTGEFSRGHSECGK